MTRQSRGLSIFAAAFLAACPAFAQKTTSFTSSITLTLGAGGPLTYSTLNSTGPITPGGLANYRFLMVQTPDSSGNPSGPAQTTMTIAFNRLDIISGTTTVPDLNVTSPAPVNFTIGGSTGIYSGATGSLIVTFTRIAGGASTGVASVSGSGTITVGGKPIAISIPQVNLGNPGFITQEINSATGGGTMAPFGNVTMTLTGRVFNNSSLHEATFAIAFNSSDSFNVYETYGSQAPANAPFIITGGTGAFEGATGSGTVNIGPGANGTTVATFAGSVTQPAAGVPVITGITAASGLAAIGQNTWIEIRGKNLTPPTTAAGGHFWSDAPEFLSGKMPTQSGGVSVTVNGNPAYVWWFCSAATTPACATDQINVLTPLDSAVGVVPVVVTNGAFSSAPFIVNMQSPALSMLLVDQKGYILATHADGSLIGPVTLFPGASTPAKRGETIVLWAVGFGLPDGPIVEGSSTQSGPLPFFPSCFVAGNIPVIAATLISPGLYQLNVTLPNSAPVGDVPIFCIYTNKSFTPAGNLITVQ